jgi:hypothetical protein
MIKDRIENLLKSRRCTLLGVGPMSKNCVDATIELANDFQTPIMLIASRRQIDSQEFGGGYVNNWTTEEFSQYVIDNDKKGFVILARDHGGPWQNTQEKEKKLSFRKAMESCKKSYEADIKSGFEIIHIDPSEDIFGKSSVDQILDRVYELLDFCTSISKRHNKDIAFEIGTEEQSGGTNSKEELEYVLQKVLDFCNKNKIQKPSFIVIQTGTKVMETRNVGTFDWPLRIMGELPAEIQVPQMIELCNKYNIFMKEHNTDYLSDEALSWHPKFGIHAANVAPEFGVMETRSFMNLLETYKLEDLKQNFIDLAYKSQKWDKWLLPNSTTTKTDKAVIAGHYVFAKEEFKSIKQEAQSKIKDKNIDEFLKEQIKISIMRYLRAFRLLRLSNIYSNSPKPNFHLDAYGVNA